MTLLLGLPVLAVLGLLGVMLRWSPRALWRGVSVGGAVLAVAYLAWSAWKTLSVI